MPASFSQEPPPASYACQPEFFLPDYPYDYATPTNPALSYGAATDHIPPSYPPGFFQPQYQTTFADNADVSTSAPFIHAPIPLSGYSTLLPHVHGIYQSGSPPPLEPCSPHTQPSPAVDPPDSSSPTPPLLCLSSPPPPGRGILLRATCAPKLEEDKAVSVDVTRPDSLHPDGAAPQAIFPTPSQLLVKLAERDQVTACDRPPRKSIVSATVTSLPSTSRTNLSSVVSMKFSVQSTRSTFPSKWGKAWSRALLRRATRCISVGTNSFPSSGSCRNPRLLVRTFTCHLRGREIEAV